MVVVSPVLFLVPLFLLSYPIKILRPTFYGSVIPVVHTVICVLYHQLTAFYQGWPFISGLIWQDAGYRVATYNRIMAHLQAYDVYLTGACLMALILVRYTAVATWKHKLVPISFNRSGSKSNKSTTHGSAKLCSRKRLYQLHQKEGIPVGGIVSSSYYDEPEKLVEDIKKKTAKDILRLQVDHSLIVAPSGAGKGIGIVIPTLLDYPGSVLVTDIKGENYAVTAQSRRNKGRQKGRQVYAIDPFKITDGKGSVSFNVLDLLDPTQKSIVDDSSTLAHLLCPIPQYDSGATQYFANQAAAVIQCLILYVACSDEVPRKDKHIGTVYGLLCQEQKKLFDFLKLLSANEMTAFGTISRLANRVLGTESRELSGTLNSACCELRFLESPEVVEVVSESSFNIHELVRGGADLYLCIPSEKLDVQSRLLRLMVGSIFLSMQKARGNRSTHPLLMLLDEMPALGYMPQIENALIYGRGYGVSLMAISQTIEKIKAIYPNSWNTFLSSHLSIFFGASDYKTCELISNLLGRTTVQSRSENQGHSQSKQEVERFGAAASNATSQQSGASFSETGRALFAPDEVRKIDSSVLIAFLRGEDPIILQRLNYLNCSHYKGMYQNNKLHKMPTFSGR